MRASLARRIAIEEGEAEHEPRRKRRRVSRAVSNDDETNESDSGHSADDDNDNDNHRQGIKEEDTDSSEDEFDNPLRLQVQQAFYNDPSTLHPAAHALPLSADMIDENMRMEGSSRFHTKTSLLEAMENASESLESEIVDLEAECERIKDAIKETIGGLSDLKYGKTSRRKEGDNAAEGGGGEEYMEILDALTQFRETVKNRSRT